MTRDETVTLTQYIHALCPQQAISRLTPLAWHDVLGHLEFAECYAAAVAVAAMQAFVAPAEIIREIATRRSAGEPWSEACRGGNHRDCRMSWCSCVPCHPAAVARLAGPPPPEVPALGPGTRGGDPRQLITGELPERSST